MEKMSASLKCLLCFLWGVILFLLLCSALCVIHIVKNGDNYIELSNSVINDFTLGWEYSLRPRVITASVRSQLPDKPKGADVWSYEIWNNKKGLISVKQNGREFIIEPNPAAMQLFFGMQRVEVEISNAACNQSVTIWIYLSCKPMNQY